MRRATVKAGALAASLAAAPLCFLAAPDLILLYYYGPEVFSEGLPSEMEAGPGVGLEVIFEKPLALMLWFSCIAVIYLVSSILLKREGRSLTSLQGAA